MGKNRVLWTNVQAGPAKNWIWLQAHSPIKIWNQHLTHNKKKLGERQDSSLRCPIHHERVSENAFSALESKWMKSRVETYKGSVCVLSFHLRWSYWLVHGDHPKNTHRQNFTPFQRVRPWKFAQIFYESLRKIGRRRFFYFLFLAVFRGSQVFWG